MRSAQLRLIYLVPYLPVVDFSTTYQVEHIVLYSHVEYLHNADIIKPVHLIYDPTFLILHVLG